MFDIEAELKKLPSKPGVYIMKDKDDHIIYVGKAISLKNRVRQYFRKTNKTKRIENMVSTIDHFEYIVVDNEAEALILECNLIKKHRPKFNVLLKDDKTYPYIKINMKEDYPTVAFTRRIVNDGSKYFGPYANPGAAKEMIDFIKQKYKIRQCRSLKERTRPCLNYHIKKCLAPCMGYVSKEEYRKQIDEIVDLLEGKTDKILKELDMQMQECSQRLDFERAAELRDRKQAIERVSTKQKVSNLSENSIDVIGMYQSEIEVCIEVFFVRGSKMIGREHYFFSDLKGMSDAEILSGFIKQYYMDNPNIPARIMLREELEDKQVIEEWLSNELGKKVELKSPKKGEKLRFVEMAENNAKVTLENKEKDKSSILLELKEVLGLDTLPRKIETYDISNMAGEHMVAAMCVMQDGVIRKNLSRRFKIKTVYGQDDPRCMEEVITRRLKHSIENPNGGFGTLPDVIFADGGITQIRATKRAIEKYQLPIAVFGMVKNEKHQTRALMNEAREELPISEELKHLITRFQDTVHDTAITYHRKVREKEITKSELDNIKGIGAAKKQALLKHFGSVANIKQATKEELQQVKGISAQNAKDILDNLGRFFFVPKGQSGTEIRNKKEPFQLKKFSAKIAREKGEENMYRTKNCGELKLKNVNEVVELAGWIQKIRDLGGMIFIDLRDECGITQIVVNEETLQNQAKEMKVESCIHVKGTVVERTNKNANLPTGEVEVIAQELQVLGKCKNVLPFEINTDQEVREDLRLEYRFLDLRNTQLHNNILLRSEILKTLRDKMHELDFTEIQTPILANSSPEGARDYLVPSRLNPGEFYALPQAPQQFKQLLMVSGFNKYYQIAPCFRDEDPRADRAPGEFYQLDFEMSFATQEDVFQVMEDVIPYTFEKYTTWKVDKGPFVRIPYKEAMEMYGIDKPDLRNPLIIQDGTNLFKDSEFQAFKGKTVKLIVVPEGAKQGRKFFDKMEEFAKTEEVGAKGLAWTKVEETGELAGGIAKFITEEMKQTLQTQYHAEKNASIFFVADEFEKAQKIAGLIRIELGKRLDLLEKNVYKFCFIVDFPMYELSDEGTIDFSHNPFSMPQGGLEALKNKNPLEILAYQYDLVCNGYEMASGAVRNHDPEIMVKAFEIAGYTEQDVKERFGALYNAFQYGTPPHAGAAPGIDRMVMLIADAQNIREVIAFPKNKKARDLLMRAPSIVTPEQLKDVHIQLDIKQTK